MPRIESLSEREMRSFVSYLQHCAENAAIDRSVNSTNGSFIMKLFTADGAFLVWESDNVVSSDWFLDGYWEAKLDQLTADAEEVSKSIKYALFRTPIQIGASCIVAQGKLRPIQERWDAAKQEVSKLKNFLSPEIRAMASGLFQLFEDIDQ